MTTKEIKYHKLYLDITKLIAEMSYSERKKVGCCIVKNNNIISFGWNGNPAWMDNCCEAADETLPTVIHSEMNAFGKLLKNGTSSVEGATMYLTMSPCYDCAKLIIQSGISRVIFIEEYRIKDAIDFLVESGISVFRLDDEDNELIAY